jgi:hypothetical protein
MTDDDIELLKLAAKAAEIEHHGWSPLWLGLILRTDESRSIAWNPLTDDGDALRLAVKLRLWVQISDKSVWIAQNSDELFGEMAASTLVMNREHGGDPHAATRFAIVRAAAEIGKAMP